METRAERSAHDPDRLHGAALAGRVLYGDDFDAARIEEWFRDEELAYFELGPSEPNQHRYGYHEINRRHGYSAVEGLRFRHVLGIGAAYGEELLPVIDRCDALTILEPAPGFVSTAIRGVPVTYVKPQPSGNLPFPDRSFDLVTCFGVLHHIPNVSHVVGEVGRCLSPGGYALIREPITSMGDWRNPRRGLTRHERGIPLALFRQIIRDNGFEVVRETLCMFSLTSRLRYLVREPVYNVRWIVELDAFLAKLPVWSKCYHATSFFRKLRATSVFVVLRKAG